MKKAMFFLLIGLLIGGVVMFLVQYKSTPQHMKSYVKNSFDEITSKLDQGGNLFLYVSTETVIKSVEEFGNKLRKIIDQKAPKSGPEKIDGLKIFDFVFGMIKKCGLMEISGIGLSSVAKDSNLNHSKLVIHHYKEKNRGLIWHLFEEKPHDLDGLKLLPADTVLARFSDCRIKVLWQWIKKEAEASNLPILKQGILSIEPSLQKEGLPLDKLLDSFAGRIGFIVTLDSNKKSVIPMSKNMVEIPDPAIAIVFSVKDDFLFNVLQNKLPFAKKSEEKNIKKLQIPVPPMPITVEPVIVHKDNLLIFASNNRILDTMLSAKESGNGLIATKEFKKISANIPEKGNRFGFVGSRFFKVIMDIQKKAVETSGEEDVPAKEFFGLFPKKHTLYGVLQNTEEGLVINFNHTLSLESFVLLPAIAVTGIVAAIAVPNLLTATQKGKQKATMGDLKSIAMAIESYITDLGEAPQGNTLEEIKDKLQPSYIKVLPIKDAWGNDFLYTCGTGDKKDEYAISSSGRDGVFNGWEQKGFYIVTRMEGFSNDIIFSTGMFTYGPNVR